MIKYAYIKRLSEALCSFTNNMVRLFFATFRFWLKWGGLNCQYYRNISNKILVNFKYELYFVSSFIFCFTGHLKEVQTLIGSALKFNHELYLNRSSLLLCSLLALAAGERTYHGYTVSENSKYICSMHISIKWKQLCEDLQAPDVQEDYETSSVRLCNVNFSNVLFSEKRQNLMRPKMQF